MDIRGAEGRNGNKCPRGLNPQRLSPLKEIILIFQRFCLSEKIGESLLHHSSGTTKPERIFFLRFQMYMNGAAEKFSRPLGANPSWRGQRGVTQIMDKGSLSRDFKV